MQNPLSRSGLLAICTVFAVSPMASAHHSFDALTGTDGQQVYDVVEGSVRVFRILNPHSALLVEAPDETGQPQGWLFELSPASQLAREGWTEEILSDGDRVTVVVMRSRTPRRGRLRALLIHGAREGDPARLLVGYGIRGGTPVMQRLRERLPVCGIIDASYERTECFLVDDDTAAALESEFRGAMGYVMP